MGDYGTVFVVQSHRSREEAADRLNTQIGTNPSSGTLKIPKSILPKTESNAEADSTGGVYFVPAFNGLFAPWWRDDVGGVCIGITRLTKKSHIARAVLEIKDVLDSMHKDADEKGEIKNEKGQLLLKMFGGATVIDTLMQIQNTLIVPEGNTIAENSKFSENRVDRAYNILEARRYSTKDRVTG
ncbi:hypothetical protein Ccrd_023728 [Cynara cardunculus var. scolymus]|uniref:Carbohydrate kinase FGGY C-terminal domain-containing protein n=1 Tax=Cynara cardunculus var. scolymus TaxID=59895 RepID=A0A118JY52_CYNCS|nr:hypothetical protein Ccrd_023728 [Cynara cardunculus var. scolymus]